MEKLERPSKSEKKEKVFYHCIRALERALGNLSSKTGLPLIGSCDWNDGFSLVGAMGKGTSVWLARFLQIILLRFSEVCKNIGERDFSDKYKSCARELNKSVEQRCYNGQYYLRGFYDDGSPLGDKICSECTIDLLPQAFSVFSSGKNERTLSAMDASFKALFDKEADIMCLFTPPFDKTFKNPGYIASYVPGIRENGGQYTHAALWAALAEFKLGHATRGLAILKACNPASKYEDAERGERYGGEPYAPAGDIYSNPDFKGRCGWTHYTGAAGWMFKVILSGLLGVQYSPDKSFSVSPRLCDGFDSFSLDIDQNDTVYHINAALGEKNEYVLDGLKHENRFIFDKKEHYLKITVEKFPKV